MEEIIFDSNKIWVPAKSEKSKVSYPDAGNNTCFAIEENSFWFKHRNDVIKKIIQRFPFTENYADIGGGNGFQAKFVAENFPNTNVYLIEPGYSGCLNAINRGLTNVYNIPFQNFDFDLKKVTAIGMYDVIEHIENDLDFLKQLKSKLLKNSFIYITVPAHNYLWSDVDDFGGHYRRYNISMIKRLCMLSGLELIYTSYFFSYIPTLTYFLRSLPYKFRKKRTDNVLLETEVNQHNPSPMVLKAFDYFHAYELKKMNTSAINYGASCIAVIKT